MAGIENGSLFTFIALPRWGDVVETEGGLVFVHKLSRHRCILLLGCLVREACETRNAVAVRASEKLMDRNVERFGNEIVESDIYRGYGCCEHPSPFEVLASIHLLP